MSFTVTMPKLSPTMEEGTIVKWHKKEGDFVESGELIMEVASDKATVEHEALDEGYLRKILVAEGDEARVNAPVAIFTEGADEAFEMPKEEPKVVKEEIPEAVEAVVTTEAPAMRQAGFAPEAPMESTFDRPRGSITQRMAASPLARRMAMESGVDLSTVKGSGPGGRVMSRDLTQAAPGGRVAFGSRSVPSLHSGTYEEEKMSPMRKSIGQRLQDAKTFIPHFYVCRRIDAGAMMRAREELKTYGVKVTYNDFVLRASALALREHPVVNSGFNSVDGTIIRFKTVDISVAVTVDGGLITPIVRHADYKNMGEISAEVRELAGRAREGKLEEHEYKGGSFTVSNLGMYGTSEFTAVINPPQGAILAVSGIEERPVVKDGKVVAGHTMHMTLSSDHRVIDGAAAAEFMRTLAELLENPAGLLL